MNSFYYLQYCIVFPLNNEVQSGLKKYCLALAAVLHMTFVRFKRRYSFLFISFSRWINYVNSTLSQKIINNYNISAWIKIRNYNFWSNFLKCSFFLWFYQKYYKNRVGRTASTAGQICQKCLYKWNSALVWYLFSKYCFNNILWQNKINQVQRLWAILLSL